VILPRVEFARLPGRGLHRFVPLQNAPNGFASGTEDLFLTANWFERLGKCATARRGSTI
jgi:hypothetical protein